MLISAVATIVQNSIGDRGGIMAKDDLVIYWVNEAILDIFRKTEIGREDPATFALAVGEDEYDPSPGFEVLRLHYMHNGQFEMEESTIDNLMNAHGLDYLTQNGTPRFFYRGYSAGHSTVKVAPPADKAYTITYSATKIPAKFTLVSEDTSTLLPSSYDTDMIRFCVMRAHELEKDFRASEKAQEHYEKNMFERADESHALDDSFSFISADELDYL